MYASGDGLLKASFSYLGILPHGEYMGVNLPGRVFDGRIGECMAKFKNAPGRPISASNWQKVWKIRRQNLRQGIQGGDLKTKETLLSEERDRVVSKDEALYPEVKGREEIGWSREVVGNKARPEEELPSTVSASWGRVEGESLEEDSQRDQFAPKEGVLLAGKLTPEELETGLKQRIHLSLRWLAEWVVRWIYLRKNPEVVVLRVRVPRGNEVEINVAEQFYASLSGLGKPGRIFDFLVGIFPQLLKFSINPPEAVSLEIVGEPEEIYFQVVVPREWQNYVERQLHATYAGAEISPVSEESIFEKEGYVSFAELKAGGAVYKPLLTYEELSNDPLNAMTTAMSKLDKGEAMVLQIVVQSVGDSWRALGYRFVNRANNLERSEKKSSTIKIDPAVVEAVSQKISKRGFKVAVRVVSVGKDKFAAQTNLDNLVNAFNQFSRPGMSALRKKRIWSKKGFMNDFLWRHFPRFGVPIILNTAELATLYHLPNKNVTTPHLDWLMSKRSAAPQNLPTQGLYLGKSKFRGVVKKVYLQSDDRRRHTYIIGQTGTGKSVFLKSLAWQDICEGRGLAFIDPHGDAVEDLLQMVPKERAEDVIYFNPGDLERPMGLNILDVETEEAQHLIINSFINLLYKLYDPQHTGIIGPQLERAVRNVMLTAMSEKGNTMIEVMRLLTDPKFAEEKIPLIKDPLVKRYWTDELARTSDFHKSEKLGYFVSKFDRFVTEKIMRNIIGQSKSAFNFRKVMDQRKILLVNLSKGLIGEENSNFLGLLLVPRILSAAMSRVDTPEEKREDFYLYVDEFQNFSTPDFAQILSEARKYRLNLIVANQYIAQIEEKIRDAVFGNVGTKVAFRVGADDAAYLEKQFEPNFSEADLLNLSIGETIVRTLVDGQPTPSFSMSTDYAAYQAIKKDWERGGMIRELSRLRYGRDREVVEAEIKQRAQL